MKQHSLRNITRFTYEFTSFLGWRLAVCRNHLHYTRYFSDKQFGGEKESFAAARAVREEMERLLGIYPDDPSLAFILCSAEHMPNEQLAQRAALPHDPGSGAERASEAAPAPADAGGTVAS